jgi:hypothetical protein
VRYKLPLTIMLLALLGTVAGCQDPSPVCPPATGTPLYLSIPPDRLPTPTPAVNPQQVRIGNSLVQVDKLITGALCNDTWNGTVYVTCDVQVYPWLEDPTFLKDCQLSIEPQTVIYVAYHNNTAYYNGCSCHTGVTPEP